MTVDVEAVQDADASFAEAADRPGPLLHATRWLTPALLGTGILALLGCLLLTTSGAAALISALPDAGAGTRWALPVASFVAESAAVLAMGAGLLAVVMLRAGDGLCTPVRARILRAAGSLSLMASAGTAVLFLLTLSDLTARPLPEAITSAALLQLAGFWPGQLLIVSCVLGAAGGALAVSAARRTDSIRARFALVALVAALMPWALAGHTTSGSQDVAGPSMIVHVLAAGAWVGGLVAVVLFVRGGMVATVLPRFSTLALGCWVAIGLSGVVTGWLRLSQPSDLWATDYGRLLLVKLALLGVLGAFGWAHRRRLASRLFAATTAPGRALLRLAAVEVLVMGATMGVAGALSATPPPAVHAVGHESVHGTSRFERLLGHKVPVISPENLLALWRPDVFVLVLAVVFLLWYLLRTRRVVAGGARWPFARTGWAAAAVAITVVTFCSGIATYDAAVWSVAVAQQAITSMLIPLTIVLSRPWLLLHRGVTGSAAGRWLAALVRRGWLVLAISAGWTALVLFTPVALPALWNHAALLTVRFGDIAVGTIMFAALLRSTSQEDREPPRSRRTADLLLLAWFGVQAAVSGALLFGGSAAVRPWFGELNFAWITIAADERSAAIARMGIAIGVLLLWAIVQPRWDIRSDTAPIASEKDNSRNVVVTKNK